MRIPAIHQGATVTLGSREGLVVFCGWHHDFILWLRLSYEVVFFCLPLSPAQYDLVSLRWSRWAPASA